MSNSIGSTPYCIVDWFIWKDRFGYISYRLKLTKFVMISFLKNDVLSYKRTITGLPRLYINFLETVEF